jgi:hypothetical protein
VTIYAVSQMALTSFFEEFTALKYYLSLWSMGGDI